MSGHRAAVALGLGLLAIAGVSLVQQSLISPSNFGGTDEWLYLDLTSRGVLGIPYANRPLVLFWHALPARLWSGSLAAFWAFAGLYRLGTGLLTVALALQLAPGRRRLALLAGVCAVAWTPLDRLRLDTVLICGYEGVTFAATGALVLWLESWSRRSPVLLAASCLVATVAALSVESVLPVLAMAPVLLWPALRPGAGRRFAAWALAWESVVLLCAVHAALPLLLGGPSYQTSGLGLDPAPWRVLGRLAQLLGRQLLPLFDASWGPLPVRAVALAAAVYAAGCGLACPRATAEEREPSPARPVLLVLAAGLLLGLCGHAVMSLTPQIANPARTQILPGPGFALALAATATLAGRVSSPRWRWLLPVLAGGWVVALGTARLASMQREWSEFRSSFALQATTLSQLTAAAPALRPGTLVLLVDSGPGWPMTFTFFHAVRYLYGDGVVGLAYGAVDFLYPSVFTAGGVVVRPWPVIRREWQVQPTFHPWNRIVVASRTADGALAILPRWPRDRLPALPPGAVYAPEARIATAPVRERERRVLASVGEAARR